MTLASFIPGDVIASVSGATIVALVWLARGLWKLSERVARIEGRLGRERGERP